jgi:hypothetical protein
VVDASGPAEETHARVLAAVLVKLESELKQD